MKLIPYFVFFIIIGFHQVIFKDITSIYGINLNITAIIVLNIAIVKSELTATWFGFFAGLVLAANVPMNFGWHALAMAIIGLTAFHIREKLNLDSTRAKLLLMFGGILIHNIIVLLIDQPSGFFFLLLFSAIPGAIYSIILAALIFAIKDKRITFAKIKEIY